MVSDNFFCKYLTGLAKKTQGLIIRIVYLSLLMFIENHSYAAVTSIPPEFTHLRITNGLSNDNITSIAKDWEGFLWIGTKNGLNRFDGYDLRIYKNIHGDSTSLPQNHVTCILIDGHNNKWVGTLRAGLAKYNIDNDCFIHYSHNPKNANSISNNHIHAIFSDHSKNIWIATDSGLNRYDEARNSFICYQDNKKHPLTGLTDIVEDKNNNIWISSWDQGLIKFNLTDGSFKTFNLYPTPEMLHGIIKLFFNEQNNKLYISRQSGEINIFDVAGEKLVTYDFLKLRDTRFKITNAYAFCQDDNHNLWIGTGLGLIVYNEILKTYDLFTNEPSKTSSLSTNFITSIYKDSSGIIWVGTNDGGLNTCNPNIYKFTDIIPAINKQSNKLNRSVKAIFKDKDQNLWIGTDYGLNKLSPDKKLLKTFIHDENNPGSISIGGASAIFEDSKGRFWVGNWGGGLNLFDRKKEIFKHYTYKNNKNDIISVGDANIISIKEDNCGNIWLGSIVGTLDKFNPESGIFHHYFFDNEFIWNFEFDKRQNSIWVVNKGLCKLNLNNGSITKYQHDDNNKNSISSNRINDIKLDKNNNLWIATDQGLDFFDTQNLKFIHYGQENGLNTNYLLSIQLDKDKNVWISSDKGISNFELHSKTFSNYDFNDGVLLNAGCSFQSQSGELFFGGPEGINAFSVDEIKNNAIAPKVLITDFMIFNKSVKEGDQSILKKSILTTRDITLSYREIVFSFQFVALNYTIPGKNQYAYKLEGFDKDWYYIGDKRIATFTNIPPGNYRFRVKASNNDGVWNEVGTTINLTIRPPFWRTLWFRISLLVFLISIIFLMLWTRTYRLNLQRNKLRILVQERTRDLERSNELLNSQKLEITEQRNHINLQKDILEKTNAELEKQKNQIQFMANSLHESDQKIIRFFVNISHEFRTPLSIIIGSLERAVKKIYGSNDFVNQLRVTYNNAMKLSRLINQVLDLQKLETSNMKLYVSENDLPAFVKSLFQSFEPLSRKKNIDFIFYSEYDSLLSWFDQDKIETILYNLLSNAFKFTPEHGKIMLSVSKVKTIRELTLDEQYSDKLKQTNSQDENYIEIAVNDNGIGITEDKMPFIFNRFYQIEEIKGKGAEGTGIGLNISKDLAILHHGILQVQSTSGKGSCFTLIIPVNKNQFLPEEISFGVEIVQPKLNYLEAETLKSYDRTDSQADNKQISSILIVEDNEDLRNFLASELSDEYIIYTSNDGLSGLENAKKEFPDLIISDIMMPGMDGIEMTRNLKSDLETSHIPIILLSAKGNDQSKITGFETGADEYITKPFNTELLHSRIRNIIAARKNLQGKFKNEIKVEPGNITVNSRDAAFLQQALSVAEKYIGDATFNIEDFVNDLKMSRSALFKKIKALTGQSINEFIRTLRLKRAAQLLGSRQYTVAEVTYMVGFSDKRYFRECFRKEFGILPSDFIENSTR